MANMVDKGTRKEKGLKNKEQESKDIMLNLS